MKCMGKEIKNKEKPDIHTQKEEIPSRASNFQTYRNVFYESRNFVLFLQ